MNAHGKCGLLGFQDLSKQTSYNSAVNTGASDSSNNVEGKGIEYFY